MYITMYAPFSALHPTPSRLTSTTSTSGTAATESMDVSATASENVIDGSCECSDMLEVHETEGDDDYVNVDAADGLNGADNEPEGSIQIQDNNESSDNIDDAAELKPNGHDPRGSTSSVSHDSDLDKKLPAKSATAVPQHKKHKANKDNRFLCSICLETVSDEPVVTRCGHLYCWSCLYQWLEPGMLLSEYTAAFGAPRGVPLAHAGSRGTGLNFLNEMTYTNINVNHRPYNPSGGRYIESRRCCPVCKADCTVDSVIPVYINHSGGSVGDDGSIDLGSADSISSAGVNAPVAAAAVDASMEQNQSPIPHSPTLQTARSSFDTDPTSNVGLRRRRSSPRRNESYMFDSPLTGTTFVNTPRPSNANQALNDTPIHRNGSQIDEEGDRPGDNATIQVPSRPVPTSPWVTNRTLHPTTSTSPSSATQQFNQDHDHTMGTSSPFRLALRPRRQPFLSASPPIMHYADTQHRGGLTSVLMGIVDSIDNLAASQGGANAAQENPVVPTLHRSDGGMGGIGRASEQTNQDGSMNVLSEDESSLEMAREFLSRLLLMLACFVVLCLLLF